MPNANTKSKRAEATKAQADEAYPTPEERESAAKREAHSRATTRLRNEYRTRLNEITKEEMKARGIDWSPKPTEEEKAAAQVAELLAAHPSLRDQFASPQPVPEVKSATD